MDAFHLIESFRNHPEEYKLLLVQLEIEQCRLYQWGNGIGLCVDNVDEEAIFGPSPFKDLILEILKSVILLFHNAERIKNRYGCSAFKESPTSLQVSSSSNALVDDFLRRSFNNLRIGSRVKHMPVKVDKKLRWVVSDQTKFGQLLADLKDLIDGLEAVTRALPNVKEISLKMKTSISSINDPGTLESIEKACSDTHENLAETASTKLDLLSIGITSPTGIEEWSHSVTKAKSGAEFLTPKNWQLLAGSTVDWLNDIAIRLYGVPATALPQEVVKQLGLLFWNVVLNLLDQQ